MQHLVKYYDTIIQCLYLGSEIILLITWGFPKMMLSCGGGKHRTTVPELHIKADNIILMQFDGALWSLMQHIQHVFIFINIHTLIGKIPHYISKLNADIQIHHDHIHAT